MGYLTEKISDEVGRLSQQRGREYFVRGAVKRIEGNASSVDAVVQGAMKYDVNIYIVDDFLDYSCTCPYFQRDLDPCKHIWAVCLAAEREGYLIRAEDVTSRELFEALPEVLIGKANPKTALVKNPTPTPGWKKQLQPLLGALEADESRSRFATVPEREIVYIIDIRDTLTTERLNVEVAQRDRKMNGTWGA
jgi:hypothetical protein